MISGELELKPADDGPQQLFERFEDLQRENERLREALGECIKTFDYLVFHRVPGMGPLLYESHNRTSPGRTVETAKRLAHQALSHARLSRPRRAS